jgi:probable addiction module antidote protein
MARRGAGHPALRRRQALAECGYQTGQGVLAGLETEEYMSNRKHAASVSHSEATIAELRADRGFAVEYLKSALEELDDPEHRAVGLLALRDVAEAYGGLATVAQEAGITREALYRALSPTGNPTLKTLLAVLHAVGMRLSVAPAEPASAYN